MEPQKMVSAIEIEADRKATEAFMKTKSPTFDGSNPDEITAWISRMNGIFLACHVPERLYAILATMQLTGEALEWWIRKQTTPGHKSWIAMCHALRERYLTTPEGKRRKKYLDNWVRWRRYDFETVEYYAGRFRTEILNLAPPDESQRELVELFWRELPASIRELYLGPLNIDDVEEVILEALEIASFAENDDEDVAEYTPLD